MRDKLKTWLYDIRQSGNDKRFLVWVLDDILIMGLLIYLVLLIFGVGAWYLIPCYGIAFELFKEIVAVIKHPVSLKRVGR